MNFQHKIHPGDRFGNLTVIERTSSPDYNAMWRCKCVCGGERAVRTADLNLRRIKSCGCLKTGRKGIRYSGLLKGIRKTIKAMEVCNA